MQHFCSYVTIHTEYLPVTIQPRHVWLREMGVMLFRIVKTVRIIRE